MCPLDERILEILERHRTASPSFVVREVPLWASTGRARERCRALTEAGMIEPVSDDRRLFQLRRRGAEYLRGDLDARNLPRPRSAYG